MKSYGLERLLVVSCFVATLETTAQDVEPESPVLRATTRLIEVTVVVKDEHGDPVTDLKSDDFELFDNGRRQAIRLFRVEDFSPRSPQDAPRPQALPASASSQTGRAFTNRIPADPRSPNPITVILIDAGNTYATERMTWTDLVYARDQLVAFLRQIRAEDQLGIYLAGTTGFWVLHEYTQSCADLVKRVASWNPGNPGPAKAPRSLDVWSEFAAHFATLDAAELSAIHRQQFWATSSSPNTNHNPWAMIESVANHLAALPGRKNLILISGQVFLPGEFERRVRMIRTLLSSGVAVYAIDPGGLAPYALDASYAVPGSLLARSLNPQAEGQAYASSQELAKRQLMLMVQSSLSNLASDTGGRVFINSNDILGAIRNSFDDSRVTYTIGFYSQTSRGDGSLHKIKVKLPRRKGATVRHRAAYLDIEDAPNAGRAQAELRQAVWSPVDATAIGLEANALPSGPASCVVDLAIGLAGIRLQAAGSRWSGRLDVVLVQRDDSGNEYEYSYDALGLNLRQDSYDRMLKTGVAYRRSVALNPKATSVRAIVRDAGSGNLGSLTIPLAPR